MQIRGHARSWFRYCAKSRKVAGSTPGGVIGVFQKHNPSGSTMVQVSTQPLTEMSTRNIFWGRADGASGRQNYHLHTPFFLVVWETEPPGIFRAFSGL